MNEKSQSVTGATVRLLKDSNLVKIDITDAKGIARFENIPNGAYTFSVIYAGYQQQTTSVYRIPGDADTIKITLQPASIALHQVNVTAQAPLIEQKQGKIVLNVDASVTNAGTTVLEVLEKSPGVTVDRNGGISLQGKTGVLVTIDDKPTYLSAADLNNLLSSMSSSQVDQIELIANPTAKYDASGSAGIINIKTKKNKLKGFNGTLTASVGQGVYPKNNDNLALNYRSGKFNIFFNYSLNYVQYYLNLYALRKYYYDNGTLLSQLDQPSYFKGTFSNNSIKTGVDYSLDAKTTIGIVLTGTNISRSGNNTDLARWLSPSGVLDSAIFTDNKNNNDFKNGAINLNARHNISSTQDISADFDLLHYAISGDQNFDYQLQAPGGYDELSRANIPTTINIVTGKIDYTLKAGKNGTFEAGWKSSHSSTDNSAAYQNFNGTQFVDDDTKSNTFFYNETIHALYSDFEEKCDRLTVQVGLRYEHTGYNANQLGNAIQKDSAFSRNYVGLFPSGYISYQADTANTFSLSAGRRIDRPAFQVLDPFVFIINKYTYETGNPYILPQYSWNLELSHQYKNLLTTSISYSVITNYFSQLFLADTSKQILLYSQGNVGHTYNIGLSEMVSASPFNWWSFTAGAIFNHKQLAGFNGNDYTSTINQLSINATSQFIIGGRYTVEIDGDYTTHARNDIQELLYPTGQVSLGLSRPVLKKKGTLKLSYRDVFHTNWMEGLTQFPNATEYFKELQDTRVITLSFSYHFGKANKADKHTDTGAEDEIQRVGNG
ncbi:MAG TPA: outer membrane beta-barrel family protein [Mucilaginibacter sp.]|nr:outer membrane beta-barrel family protein [Mucilaginibacter sp.]